MKASPAGVPGKPNHAGGETNEDCMQLYAHKSYTWNDEDCRLNARFVCEVRSVHVHSAEAGSVHKRCTTLCMIASRLIMSRLITARLITSRLITVRLITVRLIATRIITAHLITVRLITARGITARLITARGSPNHGLRLA